MGQAPKKGKPPVFDAQAVAQALEEEALEVLRDNMRTSEDDLARNDAAYKLWQIANGYMELH